MVHTYFRFVPGNMKNGTSLTFAYGPHMCIGKNFALTEINIVIIQLLRNFKFEVDPDRLKFKRRVTLGIIHYPPITIRVLPL